MNKKVFHWIVLLISTVFIIGSSFVLIKDMAFFITRQRSVAEVVSVDRTSDYRIRLDYYHEYLGKNINTTVKLKSSYKGKIEKLGQSVSIYYSKLFPHDIYIISCKVPRKGIIALEFLMLLAFCIAFKSGFDGVQGK